MSEINRTSKPKGEAVLKVPCVASSRNYRTSLRFRKYAAQKVIIIKRYCKNVDITNVEFIEKSCFDYLQGKWGRDDVQRMLSRFSHLPKSKIKEIVDAGEKHKLYDVVGDIATYMQSCIASRKLELQPIRYHERIDGMSRKKRIIGVQEPLHQMFDYVVVNGMKPMLNAKIGVFQCASLPGKGQSYGKKYIERWIKENKTVYFVKGDIEKCFPSIPMSRLKELLSRDIKNDHLLWLVFSLLDMFKNGLSIGSYLSQYLSNYYLSYAYHYASEQLFKIRRTKRDGNKRVRLVNHVLFYMDDFLLTGSSKKDLRKGMKMLIEYIASHLHLRVKPTWKICKISEAEPIDMMGFVFRKNRSTIRTKIFIKTRRYFLKFQKLIKENKPVPILLARQCISAYGWYKNTMSYTVRQKENMDFIHSACKKIIGNDTKGEGNNAKILQPETT